MVKGTKGTKGSKVAKVRCSCSSPFQDREYGAGFRVCNRQQGKNDHLNQYRCTVCTKVHKVH